MTSLESKNKIDTILFDYDGTLMDTSGLIVESWQYAFRSIKGREENVDVIYKTFGEPVWETAANFFPEVDTEEAVEIYRSYHRKHFEQKIGLIPGTGDLVKTAKAKGYKTAVVTSRVRATTIQGLEEWELLEYFDQVVTLEDCNEPKPSPQPALKALAMLGSNPENAVMIGDTRFDLGCAKNAGVKSMLAGWSLTLPPSELGDGEQPDYILEKPEQFFDLIEE